jgi:hypothetical protein
MRHAALAKQERNQKPSNTSVNIEKRANSLKLRVSEADLDQKRRSFSSEEIFSRSLRACGTTLEGGGTKMASRNVQPPGPIQFWVRRSSPGARRDPRTRSRIFFVNLADEARRHRQ